MQKENRQLVELAFSDEATEPPAQKRRKNVPNRLNFYQRKLLSIGFSN